jgi:uncharacterized protein (UPF0332 family)
MIKPEIQHLLNLAEESHHAAMVLRENGHTRFSAAQSYYTIFYLAQAVLLSKGLNFSSHSAVVAAFGKEFARTKVLDPKFHRYIIDAQVVREVGHYGRVNEAVTEEQERESFHWAEEFMQAVKEYLGVSH